VNVTCTLWLQSGKFLSSSLHNFSTVECYHDRSGEKQKKKKVAFRTSESVAGNTTVSQLCFSYKAERVLHFGYTSGWILSAYTALASVILVEC
jgi:hypothetical protein